MPPMSSHFHVRNKAGIQLENGCCSEKIFNKRHESIDTVDYSLKRAQNQRFWKTCWKWWCQGKVMWSINLA